MNDWKKWSASWALVCLVSWTISFFLSRWGTPSLPTMVGWGVFTYLGALAFMVSGLTLISRIR